ncbi:MAG TPA: hypothetical protein PK698_02210 [Bacilli bacterium]|jgi:hypothetical protein|nr:hypothetical protein [Bacilli bacterium]
MTTRELYFKVKYLADDNPCACLGYTFEDENGMIRVSGGSLFISFHDDMKKTFEEIDNIEKTPGFMFWNNSEEGEKFLENFFRKYGKQLIKLWI